MRTICLCEFFFFFFFFFFFSQEGSGACQHPNQRQKQSLSYASPLVVYWDPLQDHCWNDKVCHESLSQCQSNFSFSPKLKNSIFGVIKVN